jgi:hypothetical protein
MITISRSFAEFRLYSFQASFEAFQAIPLELLFKLALQLGPRAFHLQLVHNILDIQKISNVQHRRAPAFLGLFRFW